MAATVALSFFCPYIPFADYFTCLNFLFHPPLILKSIEWEKIFWSYYL